MGSSSKDHKLQVYGSGAKTVDCPFGAPFAPLPTSWLAIAPTASGKSVAISNIILKFYRGMFARVYCFSPSILLDDNYKPIRKYLDSMCNTDKEKLYFEDLDQNVLSGIIDQQRRICEMCKKKKIDPPHIMICIDDFADSGLFCKRKGGDEGSWLNTLAIRGRHMNISWLLSSQCLRLVGPVIRKNCRSMLIWKLRNYKEIEAFSEELSGYYPAKVIQELYRVAVEHQPYSFMFVRLDAKKPEDVFWLRFEARLLPEDSTVEESDDDRLANSGRKTEQARPARSQARAKAIAADPGPSKA